MKLVALDHAHRPASKPPTPFSVTRAAEQEIAGAFLDFQIEIGRATSTHEALQLFLKLQSISDRAIKLEDLALAKADELCG